MPAQFSGKRLPNTAAAAFFARKLNLPSNEWSDLWREAHDKAFTVAGTLNDSGQKALEQIREAVRAAIEDGETIEEFKKRFDDIVAKTGWDYRGGRNFRTRAIFETNLRTSWAAGRFAQMDEIKSERPFWQYRHGGSAQPRPEHLAWDGLILHADHPWWRTHYPPNGFGCTCHVVTLDAEGVNRAWKKAGGQGNAPELSANSPGIVLARGQKGEKSKPRLWTPPDPEKDLVEVKVKGRGVVQVPRGIDPGWDYVPGKAALEAAKAQKAAQKAQEVKAEAKAEAKTEAPQTAQKAAFKADSTATQTPEKAPTKQLTPAQQKNIADLAATLANYETRLESARAKAAEIISQSGDNKATRQKAQAALADAFESSIQAARELHEKAKQATEAGKIVINIEIGFDNIVDELDAKLSAILAKLKPAPKPKPAPSKEPNPAPESKAESLKPAQKAAAKVSAEAKKKARLAQEKVETGGRGSFEASAHMSAKFPARPLIEARELLRAQTDRLIRALYGEATEADPSRSEADEIRRYTGNSYRSWNQTLRAADTERLSPAKGLKRAPAEAQKAAAGLAKFSIPENMLVTRTVKGFSMMVSSFGQEFANRLDGLLRNQKLKELQDALNERIEAHQDQIYEPAFMSTTVNPNMRFSVGRVVLRIEVEKGTPGGAYIESITQVPGEEELLFAPPSSLRMKRAYATQDESGEEILVIYAKMEKNRSGKRKVERYHEQP